MGNCSKKEFGVYCIIVAFFLAIIGGIVAIIGAFTSDVSVIAAGFSAIFAAIWMLWSNRPYRRL